MCNTRRFLRAFFLQAVLMGAAIEVFPQIPPPTTPMPSQLQSVEQYVQKSEQRVSQWESEARKATYLTFLVGILGIVVAAIQKLDKKALRAATVVMGAIVSGGTWANNTFYHPPRTLRRYASELRGASDQIRLQLARYGSLPPEGALAFTREVSDQLDKLIKLQSNLERKLEGEEGLEGEKAGLHLIRTLTVYACPQQPLPAWVSNPPTDRVYLYFVGKGESDSMEGAEEEAVLDAYRKGATQIAPQLDESDLAKVEQYVANSSEEAASYFDYQRATKKYRFFKLRRLSKAFTERSVMQTLFVPAIPKVRIHLLDSTGRPFRRGVDIKLSQQDGSYTRDVSLDAPAAEPIVINAEGAPQGHYRVSVRPRSAAYNCAPSEPFALHPKAPADINIVCRR